MFAKNKITKQKHDDQRNQIANNNNTNIFQNINIQNTSIPSILQKLSRMEGIKNDLMQKSMVNYPKEENQQNQLMMEQSFGPDKGNLTLQQAQEVNQIRNSFEMEDLDEDKKINSTRKDQNYNVSRFEQNFNLSKQLSEENKKNDQNMKNITKKSDVKKTFVLEANTKYNDELKQGQEQTDENKIMTPLKSPKSGQKFTNSALILRNSKKFIENMKARRSMKQLEKIQEKNKQNDKIDFLINSINQLNQKQRIKKAVRHVHDGLNLRHVRNDIDRLSTGKFVKFIYYWQTNMFWIFFLFVVSLTYPILSFFEPTNKYDLSYVQPEWVIIYEWCIIAVLIYDVLMDLLHRYLDTDRTIMQKLIKNKKFSIKFIIISLLAIDIGYYKAMQGQSALRFARFSRPFLSLVYSNELRRAFKSIVYSLREILQLFLFFFFITMFFALIGWRFIGNLDNEVEYDEYSQNFDNIGTAINILYALLSYDGYPDCMLPAISYSQYFLIYFFIYLMLCILIFLPIPVAVVYEAFRNHRSKLVVLDRIKQREALLACFICDLSFNI